MSHHPNCYQAHPDLIPEDLPADICDCQVLRAIEAKQALLREKVCQCPNWPGPHTETERCRAGMERLMRAIREAGDL